jgi:hypothetical protein
MHLERPKDRALHLYTLKHNINSNILEYGPELISCMYFQFQNLKNIKLIAN